VWSATILAQAAGPAGAAVATDAAVRVQSVWDFVVKGGPMMIPIGIASLVATAVIIERVVSLRRARVIPPALIGKLAELLKDETDGRATAQSYCRDNPSPMGHILSAAIRRFGEPEERLEKHIQEAGEREVFKLRKHLRLLSVVASISPLMGLLGTIFGMIKAFQTVAISGEALGKASLLAKGIYEAMITTAGGLLVAIPVLIAYHWISGRIEQLVGEMDLTTVEFMEAHGGLRADFEADEPEREEPSATPIKIPASAG